MTQLNINLSEKELNMTPKNKHKKVKKAKTPRTKKQKITLGIIITALILLIAGIIVIFVLAAQKNNPDFAKGDFPDPVYSVLTGEEITNESLNSTPVDCVQIPNGTDGGRPQAGLTQAGVVFEAIAEANITRFAAIFQNSNTSAIGPIRSLRPYYLDWDTPFGCTVVHAGGSAEAIAALRQGGQREHDENLSYMWREDGTGRLWNNLFTSSSELLRYNQEKGYKTSQVKGFSRLSPEDIDSALAERNFCSECKNSENPDESCTERCSAPAELVTNITFKLGNVPTYNPVYKYDSETNTYLRSYMNGDAHLVYNCPANLDQPNTTNECGELVQVAPKVVIAMVVKEGKMADNYHEKISSIGSGTAYIFQTGQVIKGTWTKKSQADQIVFTDEEDNEIKLAPGQTWITAVPTYGSVNY